MVCKRRVLKPPCREFGGCMHACWPWPKVNGRVGCVLTLGGVFGLGNFEQSKFFNLTLMEKDPVYDSSSVAMFVQRVMKHGKKPLAYRLTYAMLERLREKTKQDPCVVFNTALENVQPNLEVKPRRVGGSTYQVPYEVKPERGLVLALNWILSSVRQNRSRSGLSSVRKMELEILDAFHSTGAAMRRRGATICLVTLRSKVLIPNGNKRFTTRVVG